VELGAGEGLKVCEKKEVVPDDVGVENMGLEALVVVEDDEDVEDMAR
jgi:hypothetical protein